MKWPENLLVASCVMRETLRTHLRAFSVRFRNVSSDWSCECIPNLVDGFERGITQKTSFERHNRGREDNIKWEFKKQAVIVLLGLNCISKCKAHSLPGSSWRQRKIFGCLDHFSTCRLLKEVCGVEVTGIGWVGLACLFGWLDGDSGFIDILLIKLR